MSHYSIEYIKSAHKQSFANRLVIEKSTECGCFYCCAAFPASLVTAWVKEKDGNADTGFCPSCGIDSLIGDASGVLLAREFLVAMNEEYFGGLVEKEPEQEKSEFYTSFAELVEKRKLR